MIALGYQRVIAMKRTLAILFSCLSVQLSACGTVAPQMQLGNDSVEANALFVHSITTHVHCELRNALLFTYDNLKGHQNVEWLKEWAAKITLTVNVDEKTAFSPGLTLTRFFPSFRKLLSNGELITHERSFDFGIGGSLSSNAVREQEITWFLLFSELFNERSSALSDCPRKSPFMIEGDLKIKETLASSIFPASLTRNVHNPFEKGGPLEVVQHQVSFLIEASGNVSPAWKFVDVSANTGGPLLDFNRKRKDTLLITMGPTQISATSRAERKVRRVPTQPVDSSHLAKQIGNSVGTSLLGRR